MAISLEQFVEELTGSGLLSAEELVEFRMSLPEEKQPKDAQDLAVELVRSDKLTKYQANHAYKGNANGLVFGQYVILDKLGAGGMGVVYRARHRRMMREVAVKILPPSALKKKTSVDRFHREVQAAAQLNHTNIVTAYDADEYQGNHYLVMECVNGPDLSSLVQERGPLPVDQAIECVIQTARGLEYAHEKGIVHRDIKPANLLLDTGGTVKILDMGLARFSQKQKTDEELTRSDQIMGTVDYMSPEQARDTKNADARTDIYSLGCTLYRLMTGRPVYGGETMMNRMLAHKEAPIPSLRAARQDVSEQLDAVFQKMVAKKPEDRQPSMAEVIQELQACRNPQAASPKLKAPMEADSTINVLSVGLQSEENSELPKALPVAMRIDDESQDADALTNDRPQATVLDGNAEQDTDPKTQVSLPALMTEPRKPSRQRRFWEERHVQIGAAAAMLLILLAVFFLRTPKGTLRVEISDPNIEVSVKGTRVVLKGAGKEDIRIKPGDRILHVKRGGLEFDTRELELKKGQTVVVTVEMLDGQVRVTSDGKLLGSKPIPAKTPKNYALEFDGEGLVSIPTLKIDSPAELTIEAIVKPQSQLNGMIVCNAGLAGFGFKVSNDRWRFDGYGQDAKFDVGSDQPVAVDRWTHVAAVISANKVKLFVDGRLQQSIATISRLKPSELPVIIGANPQQTGYRDHFRGLIRAVHISKKARYAKNFTPRYPFQPDTDSLALYRFDKGRGELLNDASSRGNHGNIISAKWVHLDGAPIARPAVVPTPNNLPPPVNPNVALARLQDRKAIILAGLDGKPEELLFLPTQLTDDDLALITSLPTLKKITIGNRMRLLGKTPTITTSSGWRLLPRLTSLQELSIFHLEIDDDGVQEICKLKELRVLAFAPKNVHLRPYPVYTDKGLEAISGLKNLEHLSLGGGKQITDRGLVHIGKLTVLKFLDLSDTYISEDGLAHLSKLNALEDLRLNNCRAVTDKGLEIVSRFNSLKLLHVGGTGTTDAGMAHIAGLKNLEELWLNDCRRIGDRGFDSVKGLTRLKSINLFGTGVGDASVSVLENFPELESVNLLRTRVSAAAADRLRKKFPRAKIQSRK